MYEKLLEFPSTLYKSDIELDTSQSIEKDIFFKSLVSIKNRKNLAIEINKSKIKDIIINKPLEKINSLQLHLIIDNNLINFLHNYEKSPTVVKNIEYNKAIKNKNKENINCYIVLFFNKNNLQKINYDIHWDKTNLSTKKTLKLLEDNWRLDDQIIKWILEIEWNNNLPYKIIFMKDNKINMNERDWKNAYIMVNNKIYPIEFKELFDYFNKKNNNLDDLKHIEPVAIYNEDFNQIKFITNFN